MSPVSSRRCPPLLNVVKPGQLGPGLLHLRLAHVGGHNPGEVRRQQARELSWLTRLYCIMLAMWHSGEN